MLVGIEFRGFKSIPTALPWKYNYTCSSLQLYFTKVSNTIAQQPDESISDLTSTVYGRVETKTAGSRTRSTGTGRSCPSHAFSQRQNYRNMWFYFSSELDENNTKLQYIYLCLSGKGTKNSYRSLSRNSTLALDKSFSNFSFLLIVKSRCFFSQ